jgi:Uma2 family endonuclease
MVSVTSLESLPRGQVLTARQVAHLWDEDNPVELIDGVLSTVNSPKPVHAFIVGSLFRLLDAVAYGRGWRVLPGAVDIVAVDSIVIPDLIVIPEHLAPDPDDFLAVVPLLAVEVLLPSTRLKDLNDKFRLYERTGIEHYWVVDPIEQRLVAWQLHDGAYVEVANVAGEEPWTATVPFEVTITPARLLD